MIKIYDNILQEELDKITPLEKSVGMLSDCVKSCGMLTAATE